MSIFARRQKGEEDCSIKMKEVFPRKIQNGAPMCKERNWVLLVYQPRLLETSRRSGHKRGEETNRSKGKCLKRIFGKDGIKYLLRDREIWDYFSFTMEIFGSKLLLAYLETDITIIQSVASPHELNCSSCAFLVHNNS